MKLSDMFSETKWGWAAKGEAPPETPKKPQPSEEEAERIRQQRLRAKELKQYERDWLPSSDVGEELMQGQRQQKQRQKSADDWESDVKQDEAMRRNVRSSVAGSTRSHFKNKKKKSPPKFFPED